MVEVFSVICHGTPREILKRWNGLGPSFSKARLQCFDQRTLRALRTARERLGKGLCADVEPLIRAFSDRGPGAGAGAGRHRDLARQVMAALLALMEPYTGPAILSGRASAVFFHEILGHRLEGHRQKREQEGQTFTRRVNDAILPPGFSVFDIDPATSREFAGWIQQAGTVIWNGPMGVFETPPFDQGTKTIAYAMAAAPPMLWPTSTT